MQGYKPLQKLDLFPRTGDLKMRGLWATAYAITAAALVSSSGTAFAASPQTSQTHVEAALENITNLNRPGQDGYATVWDGNKYVQCTHLSDRSLRCESAGSAHAALSRTCAHARSHRSARGSRVAFGSELRQLCADFSSRCAVRPGCARGRLRFGQRPVDRVGVAITGRL